MAPIRASRRSSSEMLAFEEDRNVKKYGVLDGACWDTAGRIKSIAQQFEDCGVRWYKSAKGPGSRVAGWRLVRTALAFEA